MLSDSLSVVAIGSSALFRATSFHSLLSLSITVYPAAAAQHIKPTSTPYTTSTRRAHSGCLSPPIPPSTPPTSIPRSRSRQNQALQIPPKTNHLTGRPKTRARRRTELIQGTLTRTHRHRRTHTSLGHTTPILQQQRPIIPPRPQPHHISHLHQELLLPRHRRPVSIYHPFISPVQVHLVVSRAPPRPT